MGTRMNKMIRVTLVTALLAAASLATAAKDTGTTTPPGINTTLRQYERAVTVAPGERANIASICMDGETVVGGGPTGIPASLTIVYSSLIFDGVRSGWGVEYQNNTGGFITASPRTGAICTNGTMTLGISR